VGVGLGVGLGVGVGVGAASHSVTSTSSPCASCALTADGATVMNTAGFVALPV
jgi:hypothetical protein